MRSSVIVLAATGVLMAGCAVKVPFLEAKARPMPTRASCPAMKTEHWKPVVEDAVHKTFDRELKKRFGDTTTQSRIAWGKTDKGDTIVAAQRIGPARFAMPEPGKGGEVEVVFRACTGDVLKIRKTAKLERTPKPLPATPAAN